MRGLPDKDKALEIMQYLEGDAFDLYYNNFSLDGGLVVDEKNYQIILLVLMEKYLAQQAPEDEFLVATVVTLNPSNLESLMRKLDNLYRRDSFNYAAKFGLLGKYVMKFSGLARFAMYRGHRIYDDLKKSDQNYDASRWVYMTFSNQKALRTVTVKQNVIDDVTDNREQSLITKKMSKKLQNNCQICPSLSETLLQT